VATVWHIVLLVAADLTTTLLTIRAARAPVKLARIAAALALVVDVLLTILMLRPELLDPAAFALRDAWGWLTSLGGMYGG